jgi:CheY-like chemotaxis protein
MAETLLLADANPTMQRVVELTCAEHGLKVVSVSDGQQALDYLVAERPALALVSVTLQKLDGFEIAGMVRDRPDLRSIPVLLLAGAFETIDEARVRASGAAGVLVKPFEPGLVIKRVKELLGMSKPDGRSAPAEPADSPSGRLVTHADLPVRAADAPLEPVEPAPSPIAAASNEAGAWKELREGSGLGARAAAVETSDGEDYFGKLDAAFESLDAQLAGRSAPAGRVAAPPTTPRIPAAIDPERRPTPPPPQESRSLHDQLAAAPRPVFEVDEDWFGKSGASSVTREELEAPQPSAPGALGAPGALSVPATEDPLSAIDWRALQDDGPVPSGDGASSQREAQEGSIPEQVSSMASASVRDRIPATYGDVAPQPVGFPAADAFAMLWAHEQGEPLPPVPPPPPVELSEHTVEAVAQRMTDTLTDRVTGDLATRVTDGLAARITEDLVRRLAADLERQFGDAFTERLADSVASRLTAAVSDRVSERLVTDLSARLSTGLAEQMAGHVAERMLQQAFGDSLRQTVHDVSERLVREEIARIRGAAKDSPRS